MLVWILIALGSPMGIPSQTNKRPPNVVIVFTDDQGYGDVGCYGATGFETPHLDRVAQEGLRLTDFYVAAPVCTPSRAALLTGCYPKRLSLAHRVLFPFSETGLHPDETTLAEALGEHGYTTACIGKWHLGHHPEFMPNAQGFQEFFGTPYSNDMNRHYYKHRDFRSPPLPLYHNSDVIEEDPDQSLLTRRYTERAVAYIQEHRERPFFLYLAHNMPHKPIHASEEFRGRSSLGLYGDVMEEIDWSVGEILRALKDNGLEEDTFFLFSSDNGPWRKESSGGLRGRKNTTWEGGMRVPCLVRYPRLIPAGKKSRTAITAMDIFPTVLSLASSSSSSPKRIDGRDVSSYLSGEEAGPRDDPFFYYRDDRLQAVRHGAWKLHVYRPGWKNEVRAPLLYHLGEDVAESKDVASDHPEVVRRLQAFAAQARRELGDAVTGDVGEGVRPVGQRVERNAEDG